MIAREKQPFYLKNGCFFLAIMPKIPFGSDVKIYVKII